MELAMSIEQISNLAEFRRIAFGYCVDGDQGPDPQVGSHRFGDLDGYISRRELNYGIDRLENMRKTAESARTPVGLPAKRLAEMIKVLQGACAAVGAAEKAGLPGLPYMDATFYGPKFDVVRKEQFLIRAALTGDIYMGNNDGVVTQRELEKGAGRPIDVVIG
jgi:hypothetical protein